MVEARRSGRPVSIGTRVAAVLVAPLAPLFGLLVAYLVFHRPRQRRWRTPSAFGLHSTQLWITGPLAKGRLHAWRLAGDPQRVVVLGHGMGLDKSRSLAQAQLLHRAGYTVVLFDFRNHGASFRDHAITRFSRRFNDDLVAVVDHVRNMPEHAHALIALWGFSFSTFPVLDTLARLDGARPHAVAGGVPAAGHGHPRCARRLAASSPAGRQRNADAVCGRRPRCVTPVDQVRAVARWYPRPEVLVVPGAGHLRAIKVDKDAYTATVLDFLARALSKPVAGAQHKGR